MCWCFQAGYFSKALDLAFNNKQYAALHMVSEDLNEKTDPELLQRCADYFIENSQFDRAVDLLAIGRKVGVRCEKYEMIKMQRLMRIHKNSLDGLLKVNTYNFCILQMPS